MRGKVNKLQKIYLIIYTKRTTCPDWNVKMEQRLIGRGVIFIRSFVNPDMGFRCFSQTFWWGGGDLLLGTIFGPRQEQSQMGGGTCVGGGIRWGTLKDCPLRPKMPPYSKIRANFGVLSIK